MFVILGAILAYLFVGTLLGRAAHVRTLNSSDNTTGAIQARLDAIAHTRNCYRGPNYNSSSYDCDCRHKVQWLTLRKQLKAAEIGDVHHNPYPMVFAWPLLGYHSFLTGHNPLSIKARS